MKWICSSWMKLRRRLMILTDFNRKDYLFSKRMAIIQKSQLPLQIRIQFIHNKAIDEYILDYNDELLDNPTSPYFKEEIFGADLLNQNILSVNGQFDRLLRNSIVTQNHITNLEKLNASRNIANKITEVEIETINKNLKTIEKILNDADVEIETYKHLVNKLPRQVSRIDILEKAIKDGKNYKGREYSFKELNQLSRDLERYRDHHSRYEAGMIENRQANREGLGVINTRKIWIWSELEDTRHHDMGGQTVRFTEKFEVVNEISGKVDYLRFPHDLENDSNNGSNTINCACNYEIK